VSPAGVSTSAASGGIGSNLQRRASAGSFYQSLSKKKLSKKQAPMSHIPGIRPSKHAKKFSAALSKYGVYPTNAELSEVSGCVK